MPNKDYIRPVILECSHTIVFKIAPPMRGTEVYCVKCADMRVVIHSAPSWRVRCETCRYSRSFGRCRLTAERKAALHRQVHPTHRVALIDGMHVEHIFSMADSEQLAFTDPPF